MKGLWIDPGSRTIRAEAGLTWGEINQDLAALRPRRRGRLRLDHRGRRPHARRRPWAGSVRKHGLACDNLLSADVVTADGELVTRERRPRTRSCSGDCVEVAVTSGSSRRSSSGPPGEHRVSAGCCCIRSREPGRSSASGATGRGARRTSVTVRRDAADRAPGTVRAAGAAGHSDARHRRGVGPANWRSGEGGATTRCARVGAAGGRHHRADAVSARRRRWPTTSGRVGACNWWKSGFMHELPDAAIDTAIERFRSTPTPLDVPCSSSTSVTAGR